MGFPNHLIFFSVGFFPLNIFFFIICLIIRSFCQFSDPETHGRCSFENRTFFSFSCLLFVLAWTLQSFGDCYSGEK